MLRSRAVRSLLMEVAGLRPPEDDDAAAESAPGDAEKGILRQAARRALLVVLIDALALVLLFVLRDRSRSFLQLDRSPDSVFTLGVLVVAVHLGFRLAQVLHLRRVGSALLDLPAEPPADTKAPGTD
ncbi:MAG TPA: hypothetical protein VNB06_04525 [Thermoanaerobaculia bacterium]|nr:hypothetical protein [Thermoanaerobaculia bacterium]